MKHITDMIPLVTGNIRQKKKNKPRKEYERCKAEYEKEKEELDKLYELQKLARKEAFQYIENCCGDL